MPRKRRGSSISTGGAVFGYAGTPTPVFLLPIADQAGSGPSPRALGFPKLRLHDLRGTHETHLLDRGISPAAVAARFGHDPVVMMRSYAKRTRKADNWAADVISALSGGALRGFLPSRVRVRARKGQITLALIY